MSEHENPFLLKEYVSDMDIVKYYHYQTAMYMSKKFDLDFKEVYNKIKEYFKPNENGFKDSIYTVLKKNDFGDRELVKMTSSDFYNTVKTNRYHLSGSMVAYVNSDVEKCVNAIATSGFLKDRSFYKKKRKEAMENKDDFLVNLNDQIQNALKIFNNAQSGAMSSSGTPIYNKSGHTSLTSTTRCLTSIANITNEKFISGNRYFNTPETTMENILSIITTANMKFLDEVIKEFNLNYATKEQVIVMIKKSSKYYWKNDIKMKWIIDFINNLNKTQLTALLCYGDLTGLYTSNPEFTLTFIKDWIKIPEIKGEGIKPNNSDRVELCLAKLPNKPPKEDIEGNIKHTLSMNVLNEYHLSLENKYSNIIKCFFRPKTTPTNVFEIKNLIREAVQTSDTDSSIYSVDELIDKLGFESKEEALSLNGVLTYFIRQMSINQHAQFSRNMNIPDSGLFNLTMKNEYFFPAYVITFMTKHYFTYMGMQEGVKLTPYKDEIKGVHLRGMKIPSLVRDYTKPLMRRILNTIENKTKLDLATELKGVADLERTIFKDLTNGDPKWLVSNQIKNGDVYANPNSSVYFYHELWMEVFEKKYPCNPITPYKAYKIPINCNSRKDFNMFREALINLGDIELVNRLDKFMESKGKDKLTTLYVPVDVLETLEHLPVETTVFMDQRTIIGQNLKSVYEILRACGINIANENNSKLISDEH